MSYLAKALRVQLELLARSSPRLVPFGHPACCHYFYLSPTVSTCPFRSFSRSLTFLSPNQDDPAHFCPCPGFSTPILRTDHCQEPEIQPWNWGEFKLHSVLSWYYWKGTVRPRKVQEKATQLVSGHSKVGLLRFPGAHTAASPSDQYQTPCIYHEYLYQRSPGPHPEQGPEEANE